MECVRGGEGHCERGCGPEAARQKETEAQQKQLTEQLKASGEEVRGGGRGSVLE